MFKGKPRSALSLTNLRAGVARLPRSRLICAVLFVIFFVVFTSHRFASYKMNTTVWEKAPINDIERVCPKTGYPVIEKKEDAGKICITTLTDSKKADSLQKMLRWRNFNSLLDMTWPNKEAYARKHGYYLFDESDSLDTTRPPSWSKIKAAQRLLTEENCDWVFWLDADTVVMNSAKTIESFLPADKTKDLLITGQKGGSYNAGAWLIRNSEWSREFLNHWWNMKEFVKPKGLSVSGDNDALKAYLIGMDKEYFNAHILVPPRCTFNSVTVFLSPQEAASLSPEQVKEQHYYMHLEKYHKGDLIAHVAGKNNKIDTTALLLKDAV
eukprot:scaffold11639_cov172-Amphora_coffeaeformis.AAC.32